MFAETNLFLMFMFKIHLYFQNTKQYTPEKNFPDGTVCGH